MKISGFVSELNPLHYGHKYLIDYMRTDKSDVIVTAMSPNFVMRGEAAILNKFERTKIALNNGIDLVIEIPTFYALQAADIYAKKGIELLIKANVTDIYFGIETDDTSSLYKIVEIKNSNEYKELLKKYLDEGISFNSASKKAITDIDESLDSILTMPNNLLAIEYIKAVNEINKDINIHMVKRVETNYYDGYDSSKLIQSASTIRTFLKNGNVVNMLPYSTLNSKLYFTEDYFNLIKYKIESSSKDELKNILNVTEGIENSIKSIKEIKDFNSLVNSLISKRNRETKIKRLLISILLNIKKDEINDYNYLRILGFNKLGQSVLKTIKDEIVITSIKKDLPKGIYREIDFTKIYDNSLVNDEYQSIIIS